MASSLKAWLQYSPLPEEIQKSSKQFSIINTLSDNKKSPVHVAGKELQHGLHQMLGQKIDLKHDHSKAASPSSIVAGTVQAFSTAGGDIQHVPTLKDDGFWLSTEGDSVQILGQNERGVLYGAFEFLRRTATGNFSEAAFASNPSAPIRWVDEWDNLDGSIERGYGGPSIFFRDGQVVDDMTRISEYARLLSSIGINGCCINNVNANANLLNDFNLERLGRVADAMRPYGVRVGIALFFDTPKQFGGLPTSDPLDARVIEWWNGITDKLYKHVPDLCGYTIKANSEGQPGPLSYNRTLADGANLFARALKAHGDGIMMYRAFVYDHHLDESNWKNDRANAAVEYFQHLDGQFEDNVVVQIKFGPIDFQIREPPSPLFANLRQTGVAIEVMVCQEYLGQQSHVVYQAPLWKSILDFDLRVDGKPSLIRDIVSGERFNRPRSGYAAVVNIGSDPTWLGNVLAMSNLYAYGRLAWDPSQDSLTLAEEWTRLTFGHDPTVVKTVVALLMDTWPTYEQYSGNLGVQTLCDILGTHYGPGPASQDGNGWGQWTRADGKGIGMDRTVATGTGNAGQYPPEVAARFESIETTPDDLLLWFHHVPYTHRLKSGKTVIQHFYDEHYAGAQHAQTFPARWASLKGLIDDERHENIAFRLNYQAGHSLVWRDSINEFYKAKCDIADEKNRVGNHPWRIAGTDMKLDGYKIVDVTPFEAATRGKAIITSSETAAGTASTALEFPTGTYDIAVNFYDHLGGKSTYEIFLNEKSIGKWKGDLEETLLHDFSKKPDGHSATRIVFPGVKVEKGDMLKILGRPDGKEFAPLDYVSVLPQGTVD